VSYDAKQMAAVLTTCETCGRDYYMTKPGPVCVLCRRVAGDDTPAVLPSSGGLFSESNTETDGQTL
jgi:hypothetical protein